MGDKEDKLRLHEPQRAPRRPRPRRNPSRLRRPLAPPLARIEGRPDQDEDDRRGGEDHQEHERPLLLEEAPPRARLRHFRRRRRPRRTEFSGGDRKWEALAGCGAPARRWVAREELDRDGDGAGLKGLGLGLVQILWLVREVIRATSQLSSS